MVRQLFSRAFIIFNEIIQNELIILPFIVKEVVKNNKNKFAAVKEERYLTVNYYIYIIRKEHETFCLIIIIILLLY